jgi:Domain of unknown function (DUF1707)
MTPCGAASVGTLEIIGDAVSGAGWATLTMKRPAGTGVIAGPGPSGLSVVPAGRRRVVMEPQDPGAGWAAGGGHLRASDAERELVIDALKAAFVQGRLSRSELARRAGQALESRTYAELAGATAGIAAGRAATAPPRPAAATVRARPVNGKVIAWAVSVIIVSPALGVAFFATYWGSFFILLLLAYVAAGVIGTPGPP